MPDVDEHYDIDILARTLYGECEPLNIEEAEAIASVVMNRASNPRWRANSPADVCLQPLQFSCWNSNDPNRARILKANRGAWFSTCQEVATKAVQHQLIDHTCGATHYYLDKIQTPRWAKNKAPCKTILHENGSSHLFFNNIDTKAPEICAVDALNQSRPLSSTRTIQAGTIAATSGIASVASDIANVKEQLEPLAWYSQHLQTILVVLTLAGIGIMLWARYDDRKKGVR